MTRPQGAPRTSPMQTSSMTKSVDCARKLLVHRVGEVVPAFATCRVVAGQLEQRGSSVDDDVPDVPGLGDSRLAAVLFDLELQGLEVRHLVAKATSFVLAAAPLGEAEMSFTRSAVHRAPPHPESGRLRSRRWPAMSIGLGRTQRARLAPALRASRTRRPCGRGSHGRSDVLRSACPAIRPRPPAPRLGARRCGCRPMPSLCRARPVPGRCGASSRLALTNGCRPRSRPSG